VEGRKEQGKEKKERKVERKREKRREIKYKSYIRDGSNDLRV